MKQIVYDNTTVIERTTTLTVRELTADLFAYEKSTSNKSSKKSGTFDTPKSNIPDPRTDGLVDAANLKNMIDGKSFKKSDFIFMSPEDKENYRSLLTHERMKLISGLKKKTIFQQIDSGLTAKDLVYYDDYKDVLCNIDGTSVSRALFFDYIDAKMHNGCYDLKSVVDILLERKDIRLFSRKHWSDVDMENLATNADEAIIGIPGYNSSNEHTEYVCFVWSPSDDDFNAVAERSKILNPTYSDHYRAIFELDSLGLRKAAYHDTFYGISKVKEDDDDDY